jgi:hypothetical protein
MWTKTLPISDRIGTNKEKTKQERDVQKEE